MFVEDVILYIEKPEKNQIFLEFISRFNKTTGVKINIQNPATTLYTKNKLVENIILVYYNF